MLPVATAHASIACDPRFGCMRSSFDLQALVPPLQTITLALHPITLPLHAITLPVASHRPSAASDHASVASDHTHQTTGSAHPAKLDSTEHDFISGALESDDENFTG